MSDSSYTDSSHTDSSHKEGVHNNHFHHQLQIINEDAMTQLGASLARWITSGAIIYLEGDLGAGKTTLVRGFLRALGHQGAVKSPTFTVVEPYSLDNNKFYNYNQLDYKIEQKNDNDRLTDSIQETKVYHFDLYRLEDPEELEYLGIRDYLDGQAIALIEWPEKGYGVLPMADLIVKISYQKQGRKLELWAQSEQGKLIISKILTHLDASR